MEAVQKSLDEDILFGALSPAVYELSGLITQRMPGIDKLRFVNSGSEATMMAMRTARAFTKKDIIIKTDGGYHGSTDLSEINTAADISGADMPVISTSKPGVPDCILDAVKVAKFNDLNNIEKLLKKHQGQVAGIIIEPVMNTAGIIPGTVEYLKGLRELADKYDTLLIFDEIVTFRLSTGGIQELTGVIPDITALGKSIGGGFPIGAFGGREDIMKLFDPAIDAYRHSGTFNGNNITMNAGVASLEMLDAKAIQHINMLGERLEKGIKAGFDKAGVHGYATRAGSLLYIQWTDKEVSDAADVVRWKRKSADIHKLMNLELMNRGIFAATRGMFNISTPMTTTHIDTAVNAIGTTIESLKPFLKEHAPHLIK